jgi:hypothetical protein
MGYVSLHHADARRAGWERLLHFHLTACELTVCIGGALFVGFIGALAGHGMG